jgi:hypothetical protein
MVPGATSWSEWGVTLAGKIATCVEVSEMLVDHLTKAGFPLSNAEDISLASELIAKGLADPDGATNWAAASQQMAWHGIPNTAYGSGNWPSNWQSLCLAALRAGIPVLFGFGAAHNAYDDWTRASTNAGVYGHAIALMGFDSTGAIVADPNTQQATQGNFVHYSWSNLMAAAGGGPSMVIPKGALVMAVQPTWDASASTLSFPAHDGIGAITLDHGQAFYAQQNRVGVYPLEPSFYDGQGNSMVLWSDGQKTVAVKAEGWAIHLEDAGPDLAGTLAQASLLSQQTADLRSQVNTLSQQVAALKAQLAAAQTSAPAAPDPVAQACLAALQAFKTALGEL